MLHMLSETGMLGLRAANAPMEANGKPLLDQGEILDNLGRYYQLVSKLNYLILI